MAYNGLVHPIEYWREALRAKLKTVLAAMVFVEEPVNVQHREGLDEPPFYVKRPSQFYSELCVLIELVES